MIRSNMQQMTFRGCVEPPTSFDPTSVMSVSGFSKQSSTHERLLQEIVDFVA